MMPIFRELGSNLVILLFIKINTLFRGSRRLSHCISQFLSPIFSCLIAQHHWRFRHMLVGITCTSLPEPGISIQAHVDITETHISFQRITSQQFSVHSITSDPPPVVHVIGLVNSISLVLASSPGIFKFAHIPSKICDFLTVDNKSVSAILIILFGVFDKGSGYLLTMHKTRPVNHMSTLINISSQVREYIL